MYLVLLSEPMEIIPFSLTYQGRQKLSMIPSPESSLAPRALTLVVSTDRPSAVTVQNQGPISAICQCQEGFPL